MSSLPLLLLLLLAALCCQVHGQRRCYSNALQRNFTEGAEWTEPGCSRARCKRGRVLLASCRPLTKHQPPGCHPVAGQEGAGFPACCASLQCPPTDKPCYDERLERQVAVGESWTLPGCRGQATCGEGGNVAAKGCALMAVPPGHPCGLDNGDVSLEYPQCCPKITCPGCYSERLDRFFGPNEVWTEPGCIKSECMAHRDGSVVVSRNLCGFVAAPFPDCEDVGESEEGDYPDCCFTFRCPGRCFSEHLHRWFSVGEQWTEDGCTKARCIDTDQVVQLPCGLIAGGPGCSIMEGNATADYPDCCPILQCEPEKPCFDERLERHVAVGESWTLPGCQGQATCVEGGNVVAKGCGLMAVPPGHPCGLDDGDVSLEYPQCCPKITCPGCYSKRLSRFFGPEEVWTESGCIRTQCQVESGGSVAVSRLPCGLLASPPFPDCELAEKAPDGDYPDCCPTFRCPGRCFSQQLSRWFSVGEKWTEEGCTKASCIDTDQVVQLPCGLIAGPPDPSCKLVQSKSADYPRCCPKFRCPGRCLSPGLGAWFSSGESWTEPDCTRTTCIGTDMVVSEECQLDGVQSFCSVVDGKGVTWPDCCPTVDCDTPPY